MWPKKELNIKFGKKQLEFLKLIKDYKIIYLDDTQHLPIVYIINGKDKIYLDYNMFCQIDFIGFIGLKSEKSDCFFEFSVYANKFVKYL